MKELQQKVHDVLATYDSLVTELEALEKNREEMLKKLELYNEAIEWLKGVRERRVSQVLSALESVVREGLKAVFGPAYDFAIKDGFKIIVDGTEYSPKEVGGGVLDVISFCLRLGLVLLKGYSPILILDEPFRYLSRDLRPKVRTLLERLSDELNVQIIMITHDPELVPESAAITQLGDKEVRP